MFLLAGRSEENDVILLVKFVSTATGHRRCKIKIDENKIGNEENKKKTLTNSGQRRKEMRTTITRQL